MRKPVIVVLITLIALSGCKRTSGGEETPIDTYIVISDNKIISEEPLPEEYNYDFYLPPGMITRYASKNFDDTEADDYQTILEQLGSFEETVLLLGSGHYHDMLLRVKRVEQLGFSHVADYSAGSYNLNSQTFEVNYIYRFDAKKLSEMNRESEIAADIIMSGITDEMTAYDKLRYFHDYLIKNVESDTEDYYSDTIYGALVRGKAHCEGYAKSFSYLCNRAGIENMIVTGYTGIDHMWNIVKLDGNWYHIDVTWDNPQIEDYPGAILYNYFMVTDSFMDNERTIGTIFSDPPRAYSTSGNYFTAENKIVKSNDDFVPIAEDAITEAVKNKNTSASIKFENAALFTACAENNIDSLSDIVSGIIKTLGVDFSVSYYEYPAHRILVFLLTYN